jgi:hypothetical protein
MVEQKDCDARFYGGFKSAMSDLEWRQVPVGLEAKRWITRTGCKTVLVVVHTVITGQRLADIVRLVESDLRVQVVFTAAPDVFSNGVTDLLRDLGGVVISWEQATRLTFDLALAASYGSVHELHAPLIVLPHGAAYNTLAVRRSGGGAVASRGVYGLDPQNLVQGGSVVPTAIVLSHKVDLVTLAHQCPEALPAAVVAGDPCYDRMLASRSLRERYRRALGVNEAQKLVVTTSTWGSQSLFGQAAELLDRMLVELPRDEYRITTLIHPNVWFGHGPRQVRAWLNDALRRGLTLVPPTSDWMGALVAADLAVCDQGSTSVYAAAAGIPVVMAQFSSDEVAPGSASALLGASAPRLWTYRPLAEQFAEARASASEMIAGRVTSEPGRFHRNVRRLMYRLLRLRQPDTVPVAVPAEIPVLVETPDWSN